MTAGLPSSAEPLGEWEKPDCELRGHFAGGHYLSACALTFASSGDKDLKRNGDLMVAELAKCQTQHRNGSKIFAKPFDSFWCCSGSGAEEFAKLTDTIYFHDDNSILVNLYIASVLDWPEKRIRLSQQTSFPEEQGITVIVSASEPVDVDLKLRIPYWTKNGSVKVNWRTVPAFADPSSYLVLRGPWKNGDRIELSIPMQLHAAPIPDRQSLQAAMYGPLVLAARFENEPNEKWYRHYQAQTKREPAPPLQFKGKLDDPTSWLQPGDGKLAFRAVAQEQTVALVPLSSVLNERYFVNHEIQA